MAFIMTKKSREFEHKYTDGVAIVLRSFTDEERGRFEKELAKIRGTKGFDKKFASLLKQVVVVLISRWEGILNEDGSAVECNQENKIAFVNDPETRKYWSRPINEYLYPSKADSEDEDSAEDGEEPSFS